jgi:hypothetical protein
MKYRPLTLSSSLSACKKACSISILCSSISFARRDKLSLSLSHCDSSVHRISFQQIYLGPNAVVSRVEGWRYLHEDLSDYFIV